MRRDKIQQAYQGYLADYQRYLRLRGFGDHINDWGFIRRGFLECWLQPGFHRFWRTWNPGIGYFVYRLYIQLGGNRRKDLATIAAFLVNGVIHNLLFSLAVQRWDFPLPFTFTSFGVLTVVARRLGSHFDLERIPRIIHLALNVGLVGLSFDFGFKMNAMLRLWAV